MNANLNFHYHDTVYDVYLYTAYASTPQACFLVNGITRHDLGLTVSSGLIGGFVRLNEGDTLELHIVEGEWIDDYHSAFYSTGSGDLNIDSEHNITTTVVSV